jgi:amphi-Trp domain-containing protein
MAEDLIEHEHEETLSREEAAQRLRDLADQLARHNEVSVDLNGLKTTIKVPDQVTFSFEVEVGDDGSEIEVEIRW